jgi:hypothetical protein
LEEEMKNIMEFRVIYDSDADVLYITTPHQPADRGIEDEFGLVWRYNIDGRALGCTVTDFAEFWYPARRGRLAGEIAKHLEIPPGQVERVLAHAARK